MGAALSNIDPPPGTVKCSLFQSLSSKASILLLRSSIHMPDTPRLTIGIPHLDRSPLLARAIVSCLEQKVPVRILVADQGKTQQTKDVIDRHGDQLELRHLESPATCLWENWDW